WSRYSSNNMSFRSGASRPSRTPLANWMFAGSRRWPEKRTRTFLAAADSAGDGALAVAAAAATDDAIVRPQVAASRKAKRSRARRLVASIAIPIPRHRVGIVIDPKIAAAARAVHRAAAIEPSFPTTKGT